MKTITPSTHKSAFSLLEMAIVLIVIALIAGSVVAGKSLVHTAKLREALGEYDRYLKAIQEFQDKYIYLPGDFNNAESYWGADSNGCPAGTVGSSPQRETCNGNGSGTIGSISDTEDGTIGTEYMEPLRMWQHLANAGLIEGFFSGTDGSAASSGQHAVLAENVPESALTGAGWYLRFHAQTADSDTLWGDNYGHLMFLGGTISENATTDPVMYTADLLGIDTKMDDGKPGRGKIRAWRTHADANNENCTENDTTQDAATYKTSYTDIACSAIFITGF